MIQYPQITGAVLAGGRSRRMGGADKALLTVPAEVAPGALDTSSAFGNAPRPTILSSILEAFHGRFAETVVVTSRRNQAGAAYAGYAVRVVADEFEDCGPLGGIHSALTAASTPLVFVCACDMPSLSGPLIDVMALDALRAGRAMPDRLLVPVVGGRPEPLHAIYPRACLAEVDQALHDGVRMMIEFFERVQVDWLTQDRFAHIDGATASFRNLNTPGDLGAGR